MRFASPILLLLAVLLPIAIAHGAPASKAEASNYMAQGNQAFQNGDFRAALAAYEQAAGTGYTSGALYFNTGNAYYRLDQPGQAIRYYLKAERLLPGDARVRHNLDLARSRVADTQPQLPAPYYVRWWDAFVTATGPGWLFVGGWVLCLVAAALACFRTLSGTPNPWARRALVPSAAVGILLVALAFAASATAGRRREAVVIADQAALHEAPGAAPGAMVHEGLVVRILEVHDGWMEVQLPDGSSGWVEAEAVGVV